MVVFRIGKDDFFSINYGWFRYAPLRIEQIACNLGGALGTR